jgi:hypothetical protein
LQDYPDNDTAILNNIPLNGFYRTGGIIKLVIPTLPSIIQLNGNSTINSNLGTDFNDPGATIIDGSNSTIQIIGTISTSKIGSYIRYYNALDVNGNIINTVKRIINII